MFEDLVERRSCCFSAAEWLAHLGEATSRVVDVVDLRQHRDEIDSDDYDVNSVVLVLCVDGIQESVAYIRLASLSRAESSLQQSWSWQVSCSGSSARSRRCVSCFDLYRRQLVVEYDEKVKVLPSAVTFQRRVSLGDDCCIKLLLEERPI